MQIDNQLLEIIKEIISKGCRCEIVPSPDGVEVYKASRKKYKPRNSDWDQYRRKQDTF